MTALAFGLYLLFVISWLTHLSARLPWLGAIRFDLMLVCVVGILVVVLRDNVNCRAGESRGPGFWIGVLVCYVGATIPFVEWPGSVVRHGFEALTKAVVFYYFTKRLIRTKGQLEWFLGVFVACQVFRVLEPLYLHQTQGYWGDWAYQEGGPGLNRLAGAPSDTVNPNGLAFVILTAIVLLHYLTASSRLLVVAYVAFLPLALYALVLTSSRTGIVGLTVAAACIWYHSKRKVWLGAFLAVAVVSAIPKLSDDTLDRYMSLLSANSRNAATARGRWDGVRSDLSVALRRPAFGHGLGTSSEANYNFARNIRSHNLYAEVAQELGFVGLAIFLAFMMTTVRAVAGSAAKLGDGSEDRFLRGASRALYVWCAVNLVLSLASYGLTGFNWYLLAGLAESLSALTARSLSASPSNDPVCVVRQSV